MTTDYTETAIEAVPDLPVVRIIRDFDATPAQLVRAHTDQNLYKRWIGPKDLAVTIDRWDGRTGGNYRYVNTDDDGNEYAFYGSFHYVGEDRLVQTFTFEGMPEGVSLDTMRFEDLGDGRTRMIAESMLNSFEARDGMLASGMEVGVDEGYEKLDALLASGDV